MLINKSLLRKRMIVMSSSAQMRSETFLMKHFDTDRYTHYSKRQAFYPWPLTETYASTY